MTKTKAQLFSHGDLIQWDSQAQGTTKTKRGVVLGIIERNQRITAVLHALKEYDLASNTITLGDGTFKVAKPMGQNHSIPTRYLVAVPRERAKGAPTTVDLYTPTLDVINAKGKLIKEK